MSFSFIYAQNYGNGRVDWGTYDMSKNEKDMNLERIANLESIEKTPNKYTITYESKNGEIKKVVFTKIKNKKDLYSDNGTARYLSSDYRIYRVFDYLDSLDTKKKGLLFIALDKLPDIPEYIKFVVAFTLN